MVESDLESAGSIPEWRLSKGNF